MKLRKLTAILLVCLVAAAAPASAKIVLANTNTCWQGGNAAVTVALGSKCPNGKENCKPGKGSAAVTNGTSMSDMAQEVVRQTNDDRAKQGLRPLSVSGELTRAACVRAGEIAGFFSHTRPDGSKWNTVSSAARGENIARGQQSADKVMASWMSSSGHRANILRESYNTIGVCAYKVGNVMHWVQLFGN